MTRFFRLIRINYVLARYNLDEIIFHLPWFSPLRFLVALNPWGWFLRNKLTRGERIRLALQDLGPIFIKAGQILSTRGDLIPEDILFELTKLQDRVPPFPGEVTKQIIEQTLNQSLHEIFAEFDLNALASASVAQVHAAKTIEGKSVVVKVLRPNIHKIIARDLDLLFALARLADRYLPNARSFKPLEIVAEISQTLHDELDLLREGANASQLRRNFLHSIKLYVPEIFWQHSRKNMLVMERIHGIPIHNIEALRASGISLKKLAEEGVEIFFTQVFRDSFFHADMHPGNIFVSTEDIHHPKYIVVDFGIMGSLNTKDQRYLAENMVAFFQRNYQRVAELHIASGWLSPDTRVDQFEGAIRAVCEPIFERPLKDISFGQLLLRLFQTARQFQINIQPQLILLQKTLLNIEGLGRQLYPDLDLWATAAPYLQRWLKRQVGVKAFIRRVRENLPYWSEKLPEIPSLVFDVLTEHRQRQEEQRFAKQQLLVMPVKTNHLSYFYLGLGFAFAFSGALLFLTPDSNHAIAWLLGVFTIFSWILAAI